MLEVCTSLPDVVTGFPHFVQKIHMHAGRARSFAGAAVEIFTVAVNDRCDCDHVTFVSPMDSRSSGAMQEA